MRLGSLYLHLFVRLVQPVYFVSYRAFVQATLASVTAKSPTLVAPAWLVMIGMTVHLLLLDEVVARSQ